MIRKAALSVLVAFCFLSSTSQPLLICSIAVCTFSSRSDTEWYVVVGAARDMTLSPRSCSSGSLILFKFSSDFTKLEHVHTVSVVYNYGCMVHNSNFADCPG